MSEYSLHHFFGVYLHASHIAPHAGFVAIYGARTALQVVSLHTVVHLLSPTQEASIGMSGTPDAHHPCAHQRGKVHIG